MTLDRRTLRDTSMGYTNWLLVAVCIELAVIAALVVTR